MLNGEGIWLLFSLSDFYSREEVVCCWSGAYLESQVFRPPVATGAGSHIISLSFCKLFPLPVCTLKLSVDFWASLSANANPSELHTVPDRSFPVLGWWPWRTRPGRQSGSHLIAGITLHILLEGVLGCFVVSLSSGCRWELPVLRVGVWGPRMCLQGPAAAREQLQVMSWMPVEFSKTNRLYFPSFWTADTSGIFCLCVFLISMCKYSSLSQGLA